MIGITGQSLSMGIDSEIKSFQGDLAYQRRTVICNVGYLDNTVAPLNGQPDGFIDAEHGHAGWCPRLSFSMPFQT